MYFWITGTTAAPVDIARAVDEARQVFRRRLITPQHCARQAAAFEQGDDYGEKGLAAWREAERVALAACHKGWPAVPPAARLQLLNYR